MMETEEMWQLNTGWGLAPFAGAAAECLLGSFVVVIESAHKMSECPESCHVALTSSSPVGQDHSYSNFFCDSEIVSQDVN